MTLLDLTHATFGRLTVTARAQNAASGQARWLCQCTCGRTTTAAGSDLRTGHTLSCGCWRVESTTTRRATHGHSRPATGWTPTYTTWAGMWQRCTNPRSNRWKYYGGRGIRVCQRWRKFVNFLADMGERPEGKTLDRKNTNGNYTKRNCRWATPLEQRRNRRALG